MPPLATWLRAAKQRLADAGVDSPALEAQMLAAHVLLVDRSFVLSHPYLDFPDMAGEGLLQRREAHEPLAYILGWREFYGRRFEVTPAVLIPRHETETLVEAAVLNLKSHALNLAPKVLDLGTGSGCIGITIKLELHSAEVTASDVSSAALDVARGNASVLAADIRFVRSDAFKALDGGRFDLIVSNPPYIGLDEDLPAEVRGFEPPNALFGGQTGLEFYELLAQCAAEFLSDSGQMMMEVGYRQARDVAIIFESCGWTVAETIKDLSGVDRVVVVQPVFV